MAATSPPQPDDRVTNIVRSYLSLRQAAAAAPPPPEAAARKERCGAMMEVVKKEAGGGGKWRVSKLVVEHNHDLTVAPGKERGAAVPFLGMEFDSVDAAKGFYYGYGGRLGFEPRTGSNRRSMHNGALIMQRFLCWRGSYERKRKGPKQEVEEAVPPGKRKRGPPPLPQGKKRGRKPGRRRKGVEVIEVESSVEKGAAVAGRDNGKEVKSVRVTRSSAAAARASNGGAEKEERDWIVGLQAAAEEEEAVEGGSEDEEEGGAKGRGRGRGEGKVKDGAAGKAGAAGIFAQSRILRELGVRVSRYSNEERRKILNKYLSKRQGRSAPGRPAKVNRLRVGH